MVWIYKRYNPFVYRSNCWECLEFFCMIQCVLSMQCALFHVAVHAITGLIFCLSFVFWSMNRYLGYRKTILLDRRKLVELFDEYQNGTMQWDEFSSAVKEAHENRMGMPTKRRVMLDRPKEEDYFYANPHECLPWCDHHSSNLIFICLLYKASWMRLLIFDWLLQESKNKNPETPFRNP